MSLLPSQLLLVVFCCHRCCCGGLCCRGCGVWLLLLLFVKRVESSVAGRVASFGVVSTLPVFWVRLLLLLFLCQVVGFQCVPSWLLRLFSFPRRCCGCCVPHRSLAARDLDHCGLWLAAASFNSHCSLCWKRLTELASTVLWLSELYTRTCPSKERLSSSVWLPCK